MRLARIITMLGLAASVACSGARQPKASGAAWKIEDHRRDEALALVEKRYPHSLADTDVYVNTSRGSTTKQHPFYCPDEVIVHADLREVESMPSNFDIINRSWRVDLAKGLVAVPSEMDLNRQIDQGVAQIYAGTTPSPGSVPRCLDGSDPLLIDPSHLPDENDSGND